MHRFLADTAELAKDSPRLSGEAASHLKVVRPRDGEEVELFDGRGSWRRFAFLRGRGPSGEPLLEPVSGVMRDSAPVRPSLTLFACVTKGSRWDWTVEKAVELSATRIVPVISERTVVRIPPGEGEAKRERWMRIAREAARQSDAKWLPEILAPVDFAGSLELVRATDCFVGALAEPRPPALLTALSSANPGNAAVFTGPEGDFTPEELSALSAVAVPVSFGTAVLRAETAAIFALGVVKAWQDARLCGCGGGQP